MIEYERQYQTLFDNMAQGAFLQNADGTMSDVNPAALELFGLDRDEFFGRTSFTPAWQVISEDGLPLSPAEHPSMLALTTGQHVRDIVTGVFNSRRNKYVWMIINAIPLFREEEVNPYQVFVTLHDITEGKRLEEINKVRFHLMEFAVTNSIEELLVETLDKLEELTGSSIGFYHFYDAEHRCVTLKECSTRTTKEFCRTENKGGHYSIDQAGVWVDCILQGKPLIHNDYQALPHRRGLPYGHSTVVRELVVPVIREKSIVAILGIGNKPSDYDQQDVELVSLMADLAWGIVEHKRYAELTRYQSEITKNMSEGISLVRADNGMIVFTNQKFDKMFGYDPGELTGKDVSSVNAPNEMDPEETKNSIMETLGKTGEWHGEIENVKKNGTHFWCHARVSVFDSIEHGKVFLGVHTDITDRKQAVVSLRESESRFRGAFEYGAIGMAIVSPEGKLLQVNTRVSEMLGYTEEELLSKTFQDITHPDDLDTDLNYVRQMLAGEIQTYNTEKRYFHKHGQIIWALLSVSLVRNSNGSPLCFISQIKDINDSKLAEEALQASERRFKSLIRNSSDSITILDKNGTQIFVSDVVERMLGYTPSELINIPVIEEMIHPNDQEAVRAAFVKVQQEGEVVVQYRHRHKNGSWVYLEGWGTNQLQNPDIRGVVVNVRDITERKQIEDEKLAFEHQLQQVQRLESLGVLAGGIAHDFNNILAVIMGHCALAEMDYLKAEDHIPTIMKAAERAAGLCRQMLAYAGKTQFVQANVNFGAQVAEAVKMLQSTLPQNAVITFEGSPDIPEINADASQINQVAMNLIINASEAIGEKQGEIRVVASKCLITEGHSEKDYLGKIIPSGGYACLEVTDTGCGMSAETYNRLFEPFYTTKFTGRGLGMSAVLGIISAHGGALQLFSEPELGTTFKIFLPLPCNALESGTLHQKDSTIWKGTGTVLLVEDEEQVLVLAKSMLKTLGFDVVVAVNGKEALDVYQSKASEITMVLTDIGMPVMNGYEMIHELKKLNPELPVVISSGFGEVDVTSQIARKEIAGLISKPFNFKQLQEVLKSVLEGHSENFR